MAPNQAIEPCPHCGSNADVTASAGVRYKCQVCGKARIPFDARLGPNSPQSNLALKQAQRARFARVAWQLLALGLGGLGVFSALLSLGASALFDFGWLGTSTVLVLSAIPVLISVFAFSASRRARQTSQRELDKAWQLAAARVVQRLGPRATPDALAQVLGVDFEYATQLMAEAEVHQLLASDDGEERVRVRVSQQGDLQAGGWDEAEQALGNMPTQAMRARKE
jgi:hypothetical protein